MRRRKLYGTERGAFPSLGLKEKIMVVLEEAKAYLRVDSDYEDEVIQMILQSAESICMDVARLNVSEWQLIEDVNAESKEDVIIRGMPVGAKEAMQMKELLRISVFYATGYLFEHRQEANHHDLVITLRNLLFSIREGVI